MNWKAAKRSVRRGFAIWADEDHRVLHMTTLPNREPDECGVVRKPLNLAYDREVQDGEMADKRNLRGVPFAGDIDRLMARLCRTRNRRDPVAVQ